MNCLEPDLQVIALSTSFVMVAIRGSGKVLALSTVKGKIKVFNSTLLGRLNSVSAFPYLRILPLPDN